MCHIYVVLFWLATQFSMQPNNVNSSDISHRFVVFVSSRFLCTEHAKAKLINFHWAEFLTGEENANVV